MRWLAILLGASSLLAQQASLVEQLDLSASQLVRLQELREEFTRFQSDKEQRYAQVSAELADERKRRVLDSLGLGQRMVEQEAICRELRSAYQGLLERNGAVLLPPQRARLAEIEQRARFTERAVSAGLVPPLPSLVSGGSGICRIPLLKGLSFTALQEPNVLWSVISPRIGISISDDLRGYLGISFAEWNTFNAAWTGLPDNSFLFRLYQRDLLSVLQDGEPGPDTAGSLAATLEAFCRDDFARTEAARDRFRASLTSQQLERLRTLSVRWVLLQREAQYAGLAAITSPSNSIPSTRVVQLPVLLYECPIPQ